MCTFHCAFPAPLRVSGRHVFRSALTSTLFHASSILPKSPKLYSLSTKPTSMHLYSMLRCTSSLLLLVLVALAPGIALATPRKLLQGTPATLSGEFWCTACHRLPERSAWLAGNCPPSFPCSAGTAVVVSVDWKGKPSER